MTATDTADIGLVSPDLADGGAMPLPHAAAVAGGGDEAPALTWAAHPDARSYAVTCYDPDAPTGSGVWHWILADLPATTTTLQRATTDVGRTFVNDLGVKGYAGAAPPPGERHRYEFRLHALAVAHLPVPDDATNAIARFAITTNTVASAVLTVTFEGAS